MDMMLRTLPTSILLLPTTIVTDSNLHSPDWNPVTYLPHKENGEKLTETMLNWNMFLRSPKGVPTYDAKPGMQSGVTIDLVWVNQQVDDILVACMVDSDDHINHHSDHHALVTVVSLICDDVTDPGTDPSPVKAWYKADHAKFLTELKARLKDPYPPQTITDIDSLDLSISESIISASNSSSPNINRAHKHKAWWNPIIMDSLRREAARALKRAKARPSVENRATYRSARNKYFHTIEKAKTNSWRRYLSTLTVDTLFQAKRYAAGSKPSPLITTLIDRAGKLCITNDDKADALFKATCVATTDCDLTDIQPSGDFDPTTSSAEFFETTDSFFTKSNVQDAINDTHPMKAPGPDHIQNWV